MHRTPPFSLLPTAVFVCLALAGSVGARGYDVAPGSMGNEVVLLIQTSEFDHPVDLHADLIESPDWIDAPTITIETGLIPQVALLFDVATSAPMDGSGLLVFELRAFPPDGEEMALTRRVPIHVADEAPSEQYSYRVEECCLLVTGVAQDEEGNPLEHIILGNSPNPVRGMTSIRFGLPPGDTSGVTLQIVDVSGRRVATLQTPPLRAGLHQITWEGRDDAGRLVASGIYFYELSTPQWRASGKMTVLR